MTAAKVPKCRKNRAKGRDAPEVGLQSKKPLKTMLLQAAQTEGNFGALPRIDGITYQNVTSTDGRPCIVAVGNTQPKKQLLSSAGFKWNPQRKMWWKYADAV